MSPIRVVLVDDHRVVQTGLRSYLTSFEDIEVIGTASSGEEALEKLEGWLPDVVVMDLSMPGGMDGIEATRKARALSPHTQVVALTAHTDEARVVAALRAGAIGYVRKDSEPEVFLAAVRGAPPAGSRCSIPPWPARCSRTWCAAARSSRCSPSARGRCSPSSPTAAPTTRSPRPSTSPTRR
jgi:DNA-binding NarL/FixJ family response regulator